MRVFSTTCWWIAGGQCERLDKMRSSDDVGRHSSCLRSHSNPGKSSSLFIHHKSISWSMQLASNLVRESKMIPPHKLIYTGDRICERTMSDTGCIKTGSRHAYRRLTSNHRPIRHTNFIWSHIALPARLNTWGIDSSRRIRVRDELYTHSNNKSFFLVLDCLVHRSLLLSWLKDFIQSQKCIYGFLKIVGWVDSIEWQHCTIDFLSIHALLGNIPS